MQSQRGFGLILIVIIAVIVGLVGGFGFSYLPKISPHQPPVQNTNATQQASQLNSTPTLEERIDTNPTYRSVDEAIKDPETAMLQICNQNLTELSSDINKLKSLKVLDLTDNKLVDLPQAVFELKNLQELILAGNNFSAEEQTKIKTLLPNTKISFTPQKNFNLKITSDWKTFTNSKFGYSLKTHPDLKIAESKDGGVDITNDLIGLNTLWTSCSVGKYDLSFSIYIKDNPEKLSLLDFLSKDWGVTITQQGPKYVHNGSTQFIGEIKPYKNNQIQGVHLDIGHNTNYEIIAPYKDKVYYFNFAPNGETGVGIGDFPKQLMQQSLSTFKFTN